MQKCSDCMSMQTPDSFIQTKGESVAAEEAPPVVHKFVCRHDSLSSAVMYAGTCTQGLLSPPRRIHFLKCFSHSLFPPSLFLSHFLSESHSHLIKDSLTP